jgi:cytochrome d ubiquinol oxidase subunit II
LVRLIAVLYIGFFLLGFDFGVGVLLPFLSKDKDRQRVDLNRRVMINAIGPHWDGNEVWLLTAGGATFAAFPEWYATMFSGFYLALFILLLALIVRGVAFEFRSKDSHPRWRSLWDWAIFAGSLIPPVLLGVAFGNLVRGVPIDAQSYYQGGFFYLLNPYALLAGIATLVTLPSMGRFSRQKTTDLASGHAANRLWWFVSIFLLCLLVATYFSTDILDRLGINPGVVPITGLVAMLLTGYFLRIKRDGWAFAMTALTITVSLVTFFMIMYPRVMISSLNPAWSLTIYNASSSAYTLTVMTVVAVFFVPIVLLYQGWSYWVFRKRIESKPESLTY